MPDASEARIQAQPDKRFQPICQCCGKKASGIRSWMQRTVRDLNLASAKVWVTFQYRRLFCANCHRIRIVDLKLFHPYLRVTIGWRFIFTTCVRLRPSSNWLETFSWNRYRCGILNHCDYPIHTGKLEGFNNKIKVKRDKAYGFHDLRYFTLKNISGFLQLIERRTKKFSSFLIYEFKIMLHRNCEIIYIDV